LLSDKREIAYAKVKQIEEFIAKEKDKPKKQAAFCSAFI
jgi:hypothetical protein